MKVKFNKINRGKLSVLLVIILITIIHCWYSIRHFSYLGQEEFPIDDRIKQLVNLDPDLYWYLPVGSHYGNSFEASRSIYCHWSFCSKREVKAYLTEAKIIGKTMVHTGQFKLPDGSRAQTFLPKWQLEEWSQELKSDQNIIGYGYLSYLPTKAAYNSCNYSDIMTLYQTGECRLRMFFRQDELRQLIDYGQRSSDNKIIIRDFAILPDGREISITASRESLEKLLNDSATPVYITQSIPFSVDAAKNRHSKIGRLNELHICRWNARLHLKSIPLTIIIMHLVFLIIFRILLFDYLLQFLSYSIMSCSSLWHEWIKAKLIKPKSRK